VHGRFWGEVISILVKVQVSIGDLGWLVVLCAMHLVGDFGTKLAGRVCYNNGQRMPATAISGNAFGFE
jgi:hypothetical protein